MLGSEQSYVFAVLSYLCMAAARANGGRGEAKLGGCRVSGADPKRHYRAIPEFWERTAVRNCWPFMIHTTYYVPD